mgnify:CR=1 FL=1
MNMRRLLAVLVLLPGLACAAEEINWPMEPMEPDLQNTPSLQNGYRLTVPREAVGDRNAAAHEQALYDVDAKYGDVVSLEEALRALERRAAAAPTP